MAKIEIYSTKFCPYCDRAKMLLKNKGLSYTEYRVDADPEQFAQMIERSEGRRSVPQIFINDKGIGGFDELYALETAGQLDELLAE